jgi:L-fuculose-phosphate aldolase
MSFSEKKIKSEIINFAKLIDNSGLNRGTSGNLSHRFKDGFFITPSAIKSGELKNKDIVFIDKNCGYHHQLKPSSEWQLHHEIYKNFKVNAVIHTHSTYSSAFSCLQKNLPAFHYMIAIFGGENVRCARYETFGTKKLANAAIKALVGRNACLLANHGLISTNNNLSSAYDIVIELEEMCKQYLVATKMGKLKLLSKEEMVSVIKKFKSYKSANSLSK